MMHGQANIKTIYKSKFMTSGGTFVCHSSVVGTESQSVLAALLENVNIEVLVVHFCIYHCIAPATIFNLKYALT